MEVFLLLIPIFALPVGLGLWWLLADHGGEGDYGENYEDETNLDHNDFSDGGL